MDHKPLTRKRLPEKLKQIRETLGLSQREMAQRIIELIGVEFPYKYVSKYERDKAVPPMEVLLGYARIGKTTMELIVDDSLELTEVLDFRHG